MNSSKQVGVVINSLNDLRSAIRAGTRGGRLLSFFSLGPFLGLLIGESSGNNRESRLGSLPSVTAQNSVR